MTIPTYPHPCDRCRFLGTVCIDESRTADLYWCPDHRLWCSDGDDTGQYESLVCRDQLYECGCGVANRSWWHEIRNVFPGNSVAGRLYFEALRRACNAGYVCKLVAEGALAGVEILGRD